MKNSLLKPIILGQYSLKNRVIMAPLTRGRAGKYGIPTELMVQYYQQRASAGLIIAEATAVSKDGRGWMNSPGLYTDDQQAGWKKVAEAVHQKAGRIFVQLWHMGAAVHPDFLNDEAPVSASNVTLTGQLPTPKGRDRTMAEPKALTQEGIHQQVLNFVRASRRAIDAGLDGVEIHAANGFLIDQFTRDSTNKRNDEYGGNINNRLRFMMEVVKAVCDEIGADKVGIRLSPTNSVWQVSDSQYKETFSQAVIQLNTFNLAYLHLLEPKPNSGHGMETIDYVTPLLREKYTGLLIANGGYDKDSAKDALDNKLADAISFGVPFIANPDLVERFENTDELSAPNPELFYTDGPEGYADYSAASHS
jgi:N-ethylmaleimide reductase